MFPSSSPSSSSRPLSVSSSSSRPPISLTASRAPSSLARPLSLSSSSHPIFEVDRFHPSYFSSSTSDERFSTLKALQKSPQARTTEEIQIIVKFLQTLQPFNAFTPAFLSALAALAQHHFYRSHAIIYQMGDSCTSVYAILSGSVGTLLEEVELDEDAARLREIEKFEVQRENSGENEPEEKKSSNAGLSSLLDSFISLSDNQSSLSLSAAFTHGGQRISSAVLKPGALFGEEALTKEAGSGTGAHFKTSVKRFNTRIAIEKTDLLVIDVYEFHHLLHENRIKELKEKLLFLHRQPMFHSLSPTVLYRIALKLISKEFHDKHEIIFKQGDVSDKLYFIKNGQVKIIHKVIRNRVKDRPASQRIQSNIDSPPLSATHRSEAHYAALQSQQPGHLLELALLGPTQHFGELGILNFCPRTCSAVTSGPTVCWAISKEDFHSLVPIQCKDFLKDFCSQIYRDVRTLGSEWREEKDWMKFKDSLVNEVTKRKKKT
jgi:CRP-like cAMP-binding protein